MIMSDDVFCMFAFLNRGKCVVLNVDGLKFNYGCFRSIRVGDRNCDVKIVCLNSMFCSVEIALYHA